MGGFLGIGGRSSSPAPIQASPAPAAPDTGAKDKLDAERKRRAKLAGRAETLLSGEGGQGATAGGSLLGG
jgi:hypothetical protein